MLVYFIPPSYLCMGERPDKRRIKRKESVISLPPFSITEYLKKKKCENAYTAREENKMKGGNEEREMRED